MRKNPKPFSTEFSKHNQRLLGELAYNVGNIIKAGPDKLLNENNPNNWYLYLDKAPEESFNDPAEGGFEIFGAHYLAGLASEEMLRDRLGDLHTFMDLTKDATPWVRTAARDWKAKQLTGLSGVQYDAHSIKIGLDKRLDANNLAGAYFGYDRIDTNSTPQAKVRMNVLEGGHFEEKWRVDANLRLPFWEI